MAYKNDSMLVIANKYGKASSDAKAELFETYDQLRDITDAGTAIGGSGLGAAGSLLMNFARLFSPSSFLPVLGTSSANVPGTSFFSPMSGGTAIGGLGQSGFGFGSLGSYPSYPNVSGKAAPLGLGIGIGSLLLGSVMGIGSQNGMSYSIGGGPTGYASAISAAGGAAGAVAGGGFGRGIVVPVAGLLAGLGGLATSIGPFFGPFGTAGIVGGSIASGLAGAVLGSYQKVSNRIINNADVILSNKVRNIETTVKELDTQSGIIRKMIKESVEGDSKAMQELL